MKFGSKHVAFRVDVRGDDPILHPATGVMTGRQKPLVAEFGIFGNETIPRDAAGEPLFRDQFGQPYTSANIRGNFWDSEIAQAQNGWTDEERELVEGQVLLHARQQPKLVWLLEDVKIAAPWPTFDTQSDKHVVAFAIEGGLVQEALQYARQEARDKVVAELEAVAAEAETDSQAADQLTAV